MTRRRKFMLFTLGPLLAVLALLAALLSWLLLTQSGLDWAAGMARQYLPQGIGFERAEGRLAGPLEIHAIDAQTSGGSFRVERVRLDWRPWALFGARLRITQLGVTGVDVTLTPTDRETRVQAQQPATPLDLPADLSIPFAVELEQLTVDAVTLRLAGGGVHRIERIRLAAAAGPDGLALRGLQLDAPIADLEGDLRVNGVRPFAVSGGIDWRLRPPIEDLPSMAGRIRLDGTLSDLRLQLAWLEPASANLSARARLFGQRPQWSAEVGLPLTALREWWKAAPELAAGVELRLSGSLAQASVEGAVELEGLPTGPLRARVEAVAAPDAVQLQQLQLEFRQHPEMRLSATGEVGLGTAAPTFSARLEWARLAWPLEGAAAVTSPAGSVAVDGTASAYELSAAADLVTPQTGTEPVRLELDGNGSTEMLSVRALRAGWHQAQLEASGAVRWSPAGSTRLRFGLTQFDPARLVPELTGRIGARGMLEAGWGEVVTGSLALESLDGELNGQALSGSARVHYAAGTSRIDSLTLTAGDARVAASGSIADELALDWRVAVPALEGLIPAWRGRIEGNGRVDGPVTAPRLTIQAQAAGIELPGVQLESLSVDGTVDPLGTGQTDVVLSASEAVTDAVTVSTLELRALGTVDDHRIDLVARTDRGDAEFAVTGAMAQGELHVDWSGSLREAVLTPAQLGRWSLVEAAPLVWRGGVLDAGPVCLRQDSARLCVTGSGGPNDWHATLNAASIPVDRVASLAPLDLEYAGTFGLQAAAAARDGEVTGQAALELQPGAISGMLEGERTTLLEYGTGRARVQLQANAIALDVELPLTGDDVIRLDGRLQRGGRQAIEGRVQARIGKLGLVSALTTEVGGVQGLLLADLEIGGTLERPAIAGNARLDDSLIELTSLGIELRELRLDLATAEDAFDLSLAASSGDGQLEAQARIRRDADAQWGGSGSIIGDSFLAVDLPEAEVVVTPELEWQLIGRELEVAGTVTVPRARIAPRDLSNTVQASPDAVIVGRSEPVDEAPPLRVIADVEVVLGPEIHIDAFGLEGRLEGSIRVREQPGKLPTATGETRVVGGTYSIYRQTLEIERGRVIFDGGPVANPGLDVRAVRRPRDVLVGVNVRGRLREPRVELFSEPPMEESQQLSYLIVGIPLGETSSGQQSAVAAAATALARSKQGSQLASKVGIQEVSVERSDTGGGASIVLGRYLSPRLYVGYGIGLMEEANSVRMRYDLTNNWKVEARSGMTSGADLLYSIEVDSSREAIPELPLPDFGAGSSAQ